MADEPLRLLCLKSEHAWKFANRAAPIKTEANDPPNIKGALAIFDGHIILLDNETADWRWEADWKIAEAILERHGV